MPTVSNDIQSTTDTTIVTTTETVVATISGVTTGRKANVVLNGWVQVTTGGSTTALTPRIRRGTDINGTIIDEGNPQQVAAAAGSTEDLETTAIDEGADLQGATYVLTVQQTGAAGNGTALQAGLTAHWEG